MLGISPLWGYDRHARWRVRDTGVGIFHDLIEILSDRALRGFRFIKWTMRALVILKPCPWPNLRVRFSDKIVGIVEAERVVPRLPTLDLEIVNNLRTHHPIAPAA